jgi:hypothetical protein
VSVEEIQKAQTLIRSIHARRAVRDVIAHCGHRAQLTIDRKILLP